MSSGVAMGPSQLPALPEPPLPDLTDPTDITAVPVAATADHTWRNALLIGGAVALAAYFLYFRKGEP